MIDLYYWTTPNGHKITIFLEEAGLPYKIFPINIGDGMQFEPDFLAISPNNKIPAMVDQAPESGKKPVTIFESGAILLYLADKIQKFIGADIYQRNTTIEWLFWQMAGLGPMLGQNHHFLQYAPEEIPYAIERYVNETTRLYKVLNQQLAQHEFIAGKYSIADMACFPWVLGFEKQRQDMKNFPHIKRWLTTIGQRPAVRRAYNVAATINPDLTLPAYAKSLIYGEETR
jgi:GSH-dependent disulfide-bond oxidoreductase